MDTVAAGAKKNILDSISHASGTDIGLRREENQDSMGIVEKSNFRVFMVADGMGGAQGGATASRIAVDVVEGALRAREDITAEELVELVYKSNLAIYRRAEGDPNLFGMGTTFVSMLFRETSLFIVHVGDSRAYRIRQGRAFPLTEDHTLVKELVKSGAITTEQAEHHPISHMLTRSLGPSEDTIVDCSLSADGPVAGDVYLVCSDGLYNMVPDEELPALVSGVPLEEGVQRLIARANERGGADNITVILVSIGADYPVTLDDISSGIEGQDDPGEPETSEEGRSAREEDSELNAMPPKGTAPRLRLISSPPPGSYVREPREDRAERIEQLIQETNAILARQQKEEQGRHSRRFLIIVLLFIAALTGYYLRYIHRQDEAPLLREDAAAERAGAWKQQITAGGITSRYGPGYSVGPRFSELHLEFPGVTTLWTEKAGLAAAPAASDAPLAGAAVAAPLLDAEKKHIRERKESLRQQIERLTVKLQRFDQPISAEFGNILRESSARNEELSKMSAELREELDTATRRLAVWFDRRKRLEVGDPINMASEVAVSSSSVKEKKEAFEKVTWDYLKELEAFRFNRNDAILEKKVADLVQLRNKAVKDLTVEVRAAIDENIAAADQQISELTQRRDSVEAEIAAISREVNFTRSIMNASPEERERLKANVTRESTAAQSELEELRRLLPDELDS